LFRCSPTMSMPISIARRPPMGLVEEADVDMVISSVALTTTLAAGPGQHVCRESFFAARFRPEIAGNGSS